MDRVKVTVCELHEAPRGPEEEWPRLVEHVRSHGSDLVLLPEMPFHAWLPRSREVRAAEWEAAVRSHDEWLERLDELAPAVVLGTRPVIDGGRRLNEAFVWDRRGGYRAAHRKHYLPDEEGFWESSWYEAGDKSFEPVDVGPARVGFLICTEMWFTEHGRSYGRGGIHLLAAPRATLAPSVDKWLAGGTAAAVTSGAYCLSSNRGGVDSGGAVWAGSGWIIEPEEGELLGRTTTERPFLTLEIDPAVSETAKRTFPRYVDA